MNTRLGDRKETKRTLRDHQQTSRNQALCGIFVVLHNSDKLSPVQAALSLSDRLQPTSE